MHALSRFPSKPVFEVIEPGVCILWALTATSAFFVGMMIVYLLVAQTLLVLTNFTTLDGLKQRRLCPLPFFNKEIPSQINMFDRGEYQNLRDLFGNNIWTFWIPLSRNVPN